MRRFQLHLIESGASICNRNRIMTGVRFTLRRHDLAAEVWHIKEPQKLPPVLSPEEVKRVLIMATSLRARAMLTLAYGCALRAGDSRGPTSRDFMPWRFLDACQLSVPRPSLLPASKNLHRSGNHLRGSPAHRHRAPRRSCEPADPLPHTREPSG